MNSLRYFGSSLKFKPDWQETKKNPRYQEIEIIGLLDQCKQILREDKIFIRNKIKENDAETMAIFKKRKKPVGTDSVYSDLKALQIDLRKHVNNLKTKFKMEQLAKFRENLYQAYSGGEHKKKEESLAKSTKKKNQSEGKENSFPMKYVNALENRKSQLNTSLTRLDRAPLYCSFRPSEPIEEAPSENETTRRPKSQQSKQWCMTDSDQKLDCTMPLNRTGRMKTLHTENKKDIDSYWNNTFTNYVDSRRQIEQEIYNKQRDEDSMQQKFQNLSVNVSEAQIDNGEANIRLPTFQGESEHFTMGDEKTLQNSNECLFSKHEASQVSKVFNEKININMDQAVQVDEFLEEHAQTIFDRCFPNCKVAHLNKQTFNKMASIYYPNSPRYAQLFQLADCNQDGVITPVDLGRVIQTRCLKKQNTVRDVYSLLDIQRKGWFTKLDLKKFMEQVADASDSQNFKIYETVEKMFKLADIDNNGKVDYWSLYFIKTTAEFLCFTDFLEQFEFEIEV